MKVKIKCSGLIVELPDGSAIDRSYYEEVVETFHVEQQPKKNKRKNKSKNDND